MFSLSRYWFLLFGSFRIIIITLPLCSTADLYKIRGDIREMEECISQFLLEESCKNMVMYAYIQRVALGSSIDWYVVYSLAVFRVLLKYTVYACSCISGSLWKRYNAEGMPSTRWSNPLGNSLVARQKQVSTKLRVEKTINNSLFIRETS